MIKIIEDQILHIKSIHVKRIEELEKESHKDYPELVLEAIKFYIVDQIEWGNTLIEELEKIKNRWNN